jgi:hypothetical protein
VTDNPLLVRLDSGHDSLGNIKICIEENADWIIKRNLRKESIDSWFEIALERGKAESPREGKTIYYGDIYTQKDGLENPLRRVFKVTVREIDRTGQEFLFPQIEVETYETSLSASPQKIVELYHGHGTSEQFHSEIKTDMNLERLPSGKFATNAVVLLLGMFAYNCLRLIGQESLREDDIPVEELAPIRKKVSRRRLRSVMQDLIYMACKMISHARKWILSFGKHNPWYPVWKRIYYKFSLP